jgi:hypothetical protein
MFNVGHNRSIDIPLLPGVFPNYNAGCETCGRRRARARQHELGLRMVTAWCTTAEEIDCVLDRARHHAASQGAAAR